MAMEGVTALTVLDGAWSVHIGVFVDSVRFIELMLKNGEGIKLWLLFKNKETDLRFSHRNIKAYTSTHIHTFAPYMYTNNTTKNKQKKSELTL